MVCALGAWEENLGEHFFALLATAFGVDYGDPISAREAARRRLAYTPHRGEGFLAELCGEGRLGGGRGTSNAEPFFPFFSFDIAASYLKATPSLCVRANTTGQR